MSEIALSKKVSKIAVIGNYLPRKCGIATFTTNLCNALAQVLGSSANDLVVVAMNDRPEGYDYPDRVKFNVRVNVQEDYYWAADFLNVNQYQVAILQHEYGIFGGNDGSYILHMLNALHMPVITNLHTVLIEPTVGQKFVIQEIARLSERLLVMSRKAIDILNDVYQIPKEKISFIPHGIPNAEFGKPGLYNEKFGLKGRDMILTFGLLGPGKGIETMIKAMPPIVKRHPEVVYVILGQTHPKVKEVYGDAYRNSLYQMARQEGVQEHVIFHNKFVSDETLIQYLQSAKIYAIPYPKKEQITSGTLSFALGVGAAIVSTPFWHAEELLSDGRGCLVPFNDPKSMSDAIINLLEDDDKRERIRRLAYEYSRSMVYERVAEQHLEVISQVLARQRVAPRDLSTIQMERRTLAEIPEINLLHLKTITDDTGIIQHCTYNVPNVIHGYCTDDNARGLIAVSLYYSLTKDKTILPMLTRYLAFLNFAYNRDRKRFRNFLSYDRKWLDEVGSEDSHARAIWGLGTAVRYAPNKGVQNMAIRLLNNSLQSLEELTSPRAWAFSIVGLDAYLNKYGGDSQVRRLRTTLAERLFELFLENATEDWPWCEEILTYANAKIPQALILAGQWIPNPRMFETGLKALEWLLEIQTSEQGNLSVIGNSGWFPKGGAKAMFDQQPLEAMNLIDACLDVYIATADSRWFKEAERCLGWFLGRNDINVPLYDFETGGCFDALQPYGVNENQGAESTLSCLIALIRMYKIMGMHNMIADNKILFGIEN